MRRKFLPLILGGALSIAAVAPAAAQPSEVDCGVTQDARGGAAALAALIAAAVNVNLPLSVTACDINILNNSLNNLLQNADIHVLENILNNSPILSGFTISLDDVDILNGIQINLLSGGVVIQEVTVIPAA